MANHDAFYDFDGYGNTQIIRSTPSTNYWLTDQQAFPATWVLDFDNGWYLPSMGQLRILYSGLISVNNSMQLVNGTLLFSGANYNKLLWSSSNDNGFYIHCLRNNGQVWSTTCNASETTRGVRSF